MSMLSERGMRTWRVEFTNTLLGVRGTLTPFQLKRTLPSCIEVLIRVVTRDI